MKHVSLDATEEIPLDNYLLRRMIGAGVFGKVYLATDKTTGDDVAIKYLRKRWTKDREVMRRFVRETNLLQRMKIDGVVPCRGGGGTNDGSRFFVMKWIDGQTLADREHLLDFATNHATCVDEYARTWRCEQITI